MITLKERERKVLALVIPLFISLINLVVVPGPGSLARERRRGATSL